MRNKHGKKGVNSQRFEDEPALVHGSHFDNETTQNHRWLKSSESKAAKDLTKGPNFIFMWIYIHRHALLAVLKNSSMKSEYSKTVHGQAALLIMQMYHKLCIPVFAFILNIYRSHPNLEYHMTNSIKWIVIRWLYPRLCFYKF